MNINKILILSAIAAMAMVACARSEFEPSSPEQDFGKTPIVLSGDISQVYETRANDSGFADGDAIGVYITDYDGETASTLASSGNRADNMKYTFDEAAWKWNPIREVYWKDKTTHIDVYGYYPYQSVDNVSSMPLAVATAQNEEGTETALGGYEASDFLWGKAEDVAPTASRVNIEFRHRMAGIRVSLVEGTGFADGEWTSADKQVLILGTKNNASVDLSTGTVTATGEVAETGITPYRSGSDWRAVVAPQEIAAGTTLIKVTVGGYAYKHVRAESTTLAAGKQHNFTITVNKRTAGDLEFTLSGESVTAWENDPVSHSTISKTYIVINVDKPGTLDSCVIKRGLDMTKIQNLKLTGEINSRDFAVMKYWMTSLSALNLKEVRIVANSNMENYYDGYPHLDDKTYEGYSGNSNDEGYFKSTRYMMNEDDEIPHSALAEKKTLTRIILPDRLRKIGSIAFSSGNLTGSLRIPEGVETIDSYSFSGNSFNGSLSLPQTLKTIGYHAFSGCGFTGGLYLPQGLEYIGGGAFSLGNSFSGSLILPESLTFIGESAFSGCTNFTGNLTIPSSITEIREYTFSGCRGLSSLTLHSGITFIGQSAFNSCGFEGTLSLPNGLEQIEPSAFSNNYFRGNLVLPESLTKLSAGAFSSNNFSGTLEIPAEIENIPANAFSYNNFDEIILHKGIESIGGNAFSCCHDLQRLSCLAVEPPTMQSGVFDDVPKDNFTLEVPEESVSKYKTALGWMDFKRISAYRNLSVKPSMACAINSESTRDFVLYADNAWEVLSKPDWVTLSQSEGEGKTDMRITFESLESGSANREGTVVFKLKEKDYNTSLSVSQYDYKYAEDEIVTIQSASKGKGVSLMFLGDGFDAKDVSDGKLLNSINEGVEDFFSIEPYKTYRDYFNVYTGISVSPESGIGSVNTIVYNRFNTTAKGGVEFGGRNGDSDYAEIFEYACKAPTITENNLGQTLIIVIPNTTDYGGVTYMYGDGSAIAYCPMSSKSYPFDFRGIIQHEAGGHGFGKLGDEYIYVNNFIDACDCDNPHVKEFNLGKMYGWYDNISLSGKTNEVPWSNLIYHEKYRDVVDIYEGGFFHTRGVYRSESNSCMNNNIPYYSSISRESIVRRIKRYAGEEFNFDDFVANDSFDVNVTTAAVKSSAYEVRYPGGGLMSHAPVFMGERPKLNNKD